VLRGEDALAGFLNTQDSSVLYLYRILFAVSTLSKRVVEQVVPARVAIGELARQLNLDQQWEGKVDFCLR
jgi:hypothetical protein